MSEETVEQPKPTPHVWLLWGTPHPDHPDRIIAVPFGDPRPDPENPGEMMGKYLKYRCKNCPAWSRRYGDEREKTCGSCSHQHDKMYASCEKCKKPMPPRFRLEERWKDLVSCGQEQAPVTNVDLVAEADKEKRA